MKQRVTRLWFKLFKKRGFDILVTHAPAYQLNDGRDLPHQGFKIFRKLMEKYRPKFFLHGHVHLSYGRDYKRYDRCIFDFEDDEPQEHLIVRGK